MLWTEIENVTKQGRIEPNRTNETKNINNGVEFIHDRPERWGFYFCTIVSELIEGQISGGAYPRSSSIRIKYLCVFINLIRSFHNGITNEHTLCINYSTWDLLETFSIKKGGCNPFYCTHTRTCSAFDWN